MKFNKEPLINWFGFTRRERRSSFLLLIIIVIILGLRVAVPDKSIVIEDVTDIISVGDTKENRGSGSDKVIADQPARAPKQSIGWSGRSRVGSAEQKRPQINLNSCDTSQLIALPGIGPVLSLRIIKYRNLLGGFASVNQLREVYGLSPETFELIRERVFADSTEVARININKAGYKELSRLPYFEKFEVTGILKYLEIKGRIESTGEMTDNKLISAEKALKVGPYLNFE